MSAIDELIREVEAAGISIRPDPPDLVVKPADLLTPELEARLIEHKAELLQRLELESADLESRLVSYRISIAIDRKTRAALLLFKPSDAEIVRDVADVYQAFQVGELTPTQQEELRGSLDYYEELLRRTKAK
jgi:hypothetical protein